MAVNLSLEFSKPSPTYEKLNVCIVGAPKVGKSTFASKIGGADKVYFAMTEKGHEFLSIRGTEVSSWKTFVDVVEALTSQKPKMFNHLVIDVMDNLYDMAVDYVCELNKVKNISDIQFGGGYSAVKKIIMSQMAKLNSAGFGITFITHVKDREIKKEAVTYTTACTSLGASIEEKILGICDLILFVYIDKDNKRKMRTKPTKYIAAAGDRSGKLPEIMDLDAEKLNIELSKLFNQGDNK